MSDEGVFWVETGQRDPAHEAMVLASSLPITAQRCFIQVIRLLNEALIPFALAGAFGLYYYAGFWRPTKDLDLVIEPSSRDAAVALLTQAGFQDLFTRKPYDVNWIYRSVKRGVVVDLIFQAANYHTIGTAGRVDAGWFDRALPARFLGQDVKVIGAADLCWMKMAVLHSKRCDFPDIINIIRGTRGQIDWNHWIDLSGDYVGMIATIVALYDVICPTCREDIPLDVRARLAGNERYPEHDCPDYLFWREGQPWLTTRGASLTLRPTK